MKDGKPESLAEALLLIEKMKGKLSEKDQKIEKQKQEIQKQQDEINELKEKLALKQAREFGKKSEKTRKLNENLPFAIADEDPDVQIENPCPSVTDEDLAAESEEQAEYTPKKKKKSKTEFSFRDSELPEREVIQDLTEEQRKCPNCGTTMVKVREEITYSLVHIPAREYIEKIVRYIYECPLCIKDDDKPVTKSAKDKRVIEKSLATPELLAFVFVQKHMMHTPYYCLEDAYNWQGIHLSRQNFCNWQQKIYKQTEKLRLLFERELKNGKYLQFDETPIEIQKKNDEEIRAEYWDDSRYRKKKETDGEDEEIAESQARKNCYMWVVLGGSGEGARSSCRILTMIETAKIHNISPEDYLRCVFERAPYCKTTTDWEKLLPWNIKITPYEPRGEWVNI